MLFVNPLLVTNSSVEALKSLDLLLSKDRVILSCLRSMQRPFAHVIGCYFIDLRMHTVPWHQWKSQNRHLKKISFMREMREGWREKSPVVIAMGSVQWTVLHSWDRSSTRLETEHYESEIECHDSRTVERRERRRLDLKFDSCHAAPTGTNQVN